MITVYKYPVTTSFTLRIPVDAEVLSVQCQHGDPQLWVKLDTVAPSVERRFQVYGTGHEIHPEWAAAKFVGTFQMAQGGLVFHLFEAVK